MWKKNLDDPILYAVATHRTVAYDCYETTEHLNGPNVAMTVNRQKQTNLESRAVRLTFIFLCKYNTQNNIIYSTHAQQGTHITSTTAAKWNALGVL